MAFARMEIADWLDPLRRWPTLVMLLAFLVFFLSGSAYLAFASSSGVEKPVWEKGVISVVGNAPLTQVILTTEKGSEYLLSGKWGEEFRRLSGAWVKVQGSVGKGLPGFAEKGINVDKYRIEAIQTTSGKFKPQVGALVTLNDELFLLTEDRRVFRVIGNLLPEIRSFRGAKVWITGKVLGKGLNLDLDAGAYQVIARRE